MEEKIKVGIVGFGRFGKVWKEILEQDFPIAVLTRTGDAKKFYSENDVIFIAVPISAFAEVIKKHAKFMRPGQLIADVLSVKVHPKQVFEKLLPAGIEALLTHPMFGPDSIRLHGLAGLPLILDKFKCSPAKYDFWKGYFESKRLKIIEMSAAEHDKLAAESQGVTHFMGRLLQVYGLRPTKIDTIGAIKLNEVMDQVCNDTWELFQGLQNYNPYTKKMRLDIGKAYDKVYNLLLPKQLEKEVLNIGIQGGRGSFNEQALNEYLLRHGIKKVKVHYLFTTEKVMRNLHYGNIDLGLFAIHNSVGGMVTESIQAIAKYKFNIVEEFGIKISHMLMHLPTIDPQSIKLVMAHDQVLKQCQSNLAKTFPNLKQVSGKGDLLDTATAAKALAQGKIPQDRFILGPEILAELYGLKIHARDLQDSAQNFTSFLMVAR
jgi:prephenate dehydrogenase